MEDRRWDYIRRMFDSAEKHEAVVLWELLVRAGICYECECGDLPEVGETCSCGAVQSNGGDHA